MEAEEVRTSGTSKVKVVENDGEKHEEKTWTKHERQMAETIRILCISMEMYLKGIEKARAMGHEPSPKVDDVLFAQRMMLVIAKAEAARVLGPEKEEDDDN